MDNHPRPDPRRMAELELQSSFAALTREAGLEDIASAIGKPLKSHTDTQLDLILSADRKMEEIKSRVRKFASASIPILILGETGVGKERIAAALHGPRPVGSFVPINCGAIPSELLESELFGSVKGAFTSATARIGLVEKARGGTLFLDEIGDMPPLLQCKLLRVIEDKRYRKVGDTTETPIDFRLVSATNHVDLESKDNFRPDLFYRLAGHIIHIPPLRERVPEDIDLIIASIARPDLIDKIKSHIIDNPLKGNVRQLINIIREFNILY